MAGKKTTSKIIKAKPSKKTSKAAAEKAPAKPVEQEPPKIIDRSIKNDRSVEMRGDVGITAPTVAQIQRALLQQDMAKDETDRSSIKFYLGPVESTKYRLQDQSALADTMTLVSRPVDTIVSSGLLPDALRAFLSATGKRFMLAGATMYLGVQKGQAPYGKNKSNQVRRKLFNDYKTDLQTVVMLKSGETDRRKVYKDLLSAKAYNAMEILNYGEKGLIDGILINHDKVIIREDMDRYFRSKKMKPSQIEAFIKHYINVYKLPTRLLKDFAPESIPCGTFSYYQSLKKPAADEKKKQTKDKEAKDKEKEEETKSEVKKPLSFMSATKKSIPCLPGFGPIRTNLPSA